MSKTILERYGNFAAKNPVIVIILAIAFTIFMGVNAAQLEIITDFEQTLPQDLKALENSRLLKDKFDEPNTFFILVELNNDEYLKNQIEDVRDPGIMTRLLELEKILKDRPEIQNAYGAPDILLQTYGEIPEDPEMLKTAFKNVEGTMISNDYTFTLLFIETNIGTDDEKILSFVENVERDIRSVGFPGSVKLTVTGGSLIQTTIFTLLLSDLINTVSLAAVLILIVLILAYRSPFKGIFSLSLLLISLIWTGGTMYILQIPLSIITVMVGAMIIGIGIDYTIHVMNRYTEERKKGNNKVSSSSTSVDKIGKAIIATSVTTIASFLSLAGSGIPFLADMGIALSLGIVYATAASLLVLPSLVVIEERISLKCKRSFA